MTAQTNLAAELLAILRQAEKEMAKLKDEYLSAEHYLLALADSGVAARQAAARRRRHARQSSCRRSSRCAVRSA